MRNTKKGVGKKIHLEKKRRLNDIYAYIHLHKCLLFMSFNKTDS